MGRALPGTRRTPHRRENLSPKGSSRKEALLAAARTVLMEAGYTQFSLRNVAAAAGMRLSHLQYYFPTRDVLIEELLAHVEQQYLQAIRERVEGLPDDPVQRLAGTVHVLVADIQSSDTRRFFIQLWALLESVDPGARLLNRLYRANIATFADYIGRINPQLSRRERQQRAAMIAAMIDGMMLMLDDAEQFTRKDEERIAAAMRRQILRIATDPA